jgi:hypothetical protein
MVTRTQLPGEMLTAVANEKATVPSGLPIAKPHPNPKLLLYTLRVVAADTLRAVPNVRVLLTNVGRSADGGSFPYQTDANGIVDVDMSPEPDGPEPWQIHLEPSNDSPYQRTSFSDPLSMLIMLPDGTYFPDTFRLALKE